MWLVRSAAAVLLLLAGCQPSPITGSFVRVPLFAGDDGSVVLKHWTIAGTAPDDLWVLTTARRQLHHWDGQRWLAVAEGVEAKQLTAAGRNKACVYYGGPAKVFDADRTVTTLSGLDGKPLRSTTIVRGHDGDLYVWAATDPYQLWRLRDGVGERLPDPPDSSFHLYQVMSRNEVWMYSVRSWNPNARFARFDGRSWTEITYATDPQIIVAGNDRYIDAPPEQEESDLAAVTIEVGVRMLRDTGADPSRVYGAVARLSGTRWTKVEMSPPEELRGSDQNSLYYEGIQPAASGAGEIGVVGKLERRGVRGDTPGSRQLVYHRLQENKLTQGVVLFSDTTFDGHPRYVTTLEDGSLVFVYLHSDKTIDLLVGRP